MKKIIALLTVFALCICTSIPVFAAESSTAEIEPIIVSSTRGTDYGNAWISSSSAGSFTVTTSKSGTIYMTLKVESSSSDSFAEVSVWKPNGSAYDGIIHVDPSSENGGGVHLQMYCAQSGTYTIGYNASTTAGMRLMCWIY